MFSQISRFAQLEEASSLASVAHIVLRAAISAVGVAIAYKVGRKYKTADGLRSGSHYLLSSWHDCHSNCTELNLLLLQAPVCSQQRRMHVSLLYVCDPDEISLGQSYLPRL